MILENKNKESRTVEIDIIPILKVLLSKLWLMLLVGVLAGVVTFAATKIFINPTYRCGFNAYINNQQTQNSKDTVSYSDLNASKQLSNTYKIILRSSSVLTAAAESIGANLSYGQLSKMVTTETQGDTEIITVYVVDEDPQFAYDLAVAIAETAPGIMAEKVEGSSMKIIDDPMYNETRYKPSYIKYGLLGFILGLLIVAVITIINYVRDDTIKSEDEIEQRFGLPILGVLPDTATAGKSGSKYYSYEYGEKNEQEVQKKGEQEHE